MATYLIFSCIKPTVASDPKDFPVVAGMVRSKLEEDCPGVQWKASYALMGRFDVLDIVEADDPKDVERATMVIRANGHSITETMLATPWSEFLAAL
ncbi:GYD domain-containing protein [candidate division KSB1 bacterium]